MPLATRATIDTAGGGLILAAGQTHVSIVGAPWAVVGDPVVDHGNGPHNAAVLAFGSTHVRILGLPAVFAGSLATCSHPTTGSGHVSVDA